MPRMLTYTVERHHTGILVFEMYDNLTLINAKYAVGSPNNLNNTSTSFSTGRSYLTEKNFINNKLSITTQNKYIGIGTNIKVWGVK